MAAPGGLGLRAATPAHSLAMARSCWTSSVPLAVPLSASGQTGLHPGHFDFGQENLNDRSPRSCDTLASGCYALLRIVTRGGANTENSGFCRCRRIQGCADLSRQKRRIDRLIEDFRRFAGHFDPLRLVSATEYDSHVRAQPANLRHQFLAAHLRHHHVRSHAPCDEWSLRGNASPFGGRNAQ